MQNGAIFVVRDEVNRILKDSSDVNRVSWGHRVFAQVVGKLISNLYFLVL